MSHISKRHHPFRRAFDCTQYEDGDDFAGCLCPAWDNHILDAQPGKPLRVLRGCAQKMFQFMVRSAVVTSLQVLEVVDGPNGLRGDVQQMGGRVDAAVATGMGEIGRSLALTLSPIVRSPRYVDLLMHAGAERVDDGRHAVLIGEIKEDAAHAEAATGRQVLPAGIEVADAVRAEEVSGDGLRRDAEGRTAVVGGNC